MNTPARPRTLPFQAFITDVVRHVTFSPDSTRLVLAGGKRLSQVWDTERRRELRTLRGRLSLAETAAFSPDGQFVALASQNGTVTLWSSSPGCETYPVGCCGWGDAYSPAGKLLSLSGPWEDPRIWDAESGQVPVRSLLSLGHEGRCRHRQLRLALRGRRRTRDGDPLRTRRTQLAPGWKQPRSSARDRTDAEEGACTWRSLLTYLSA